MYVVKKILENFDQHTFDQRYHVIPRQQNKLFGFSGLVQTDLHYCPRFVLPISYRRVSSLLNTTREYGRQHQKSCSFNESYFWS